MTSLPSTALHSPGHSLFWVCVPDCTVYLSPCLSFVSLLSVVVFLTRLSCPCVHLVLGFLLVCVYYRACPRVILFAAEPISEFVCLIKELAFTSCPHDSLIWIKASIAGFKRDEEKLTFLQLSWPISLNCLHLYRDKEMVQNPECKTLKNIYFSLFLLLVISNFLWKECHIFIYHTLDPTVYEPCFSVVTAL